MLWFIKKIILKCVNKIKYYKVCRFGSNVNIGHNSIFEGMNQIFSNTSFVGHLGFGSYIGNDCRLSANIGRFTSIAPYVRCNAGTHPYTYPFATTAPCFYALNPYHVQNGSTFATEQVYDELSLYDKDKRIAVNIGSDCWIGEGAFLVGGINVGNGAIVLAHAVVTKDVPDYSIVGGVPAKVISYRYDNDTIKFLQEIKWWNNEEEWFKQHWKLLTDIDELKKYYECKCG